jgi:D-alanyl-lipoteichoic acid acyltransferase DltB (MBOAT superfamily)
MRLDEHAQTVGTPSPPHRQFLPTAKPPTRPDRGLYPGEPEACRRSLKRFLPILAHLGLLVAVFKEYKLEGRAFEILSYVALAALPVHYALPYRWKKPAFLAASLVGLGWVFGPAVAAVVVGLAAALIGVCYLPAPWTVRASLVGLLAAAMAAARGSLLAALPVPPLVWPVLASMFMFRLVIYLYELKHAKGREPLIDTIGYFFLLPNYCFIHFPVVDYRTFRRCYFAADIHAIQRQGLAMMLRGTIHLLLYRLIYHKLLIPMEEVHNAATLAAFLTCNYLLYLRVSGQFHMACGMLHLFGYQLPETHHHYLLANSFTDYWRRINIYWKDFMVRVVFNPVVFRLKRRPQWQALAVATATVFVVTWALHAYQSFWLRGSWGFSVPDALFWGVLGLLVMVNVQLDARRSRARTLKSKGSGLSARALGVRALKTAGTFATITLLWSLWSSPSVGSWLEMLGRAGAGGSGLGEAWAGVVDLTNSLRESL